jgi:hypothetical protein
MPKKPTAKAMSFEQLVKDAYSQLKSIYDEGMKLHPDRNESSRRAEGKIACNVYLSGIQRLPKGGKKDCRGFIKSMLSRYDRFMSQHYSPSEERIDEWYNSDWHDYLREEHHVGDPAWKQSALSAEVRHASTLSIDQIKVLFSREFAYILIYNEHIAALNPPLDITEDSEPDAYVIEHEHARRPDSYDRWQCTTFILTLIDAATNYTIDYSRELPESSPQLNIYNLNVTKLAESISLVTGLSAHNIKKDIYRWRNGKATEHNGRLSKVRESLVSFGVKIDTRIIDEALEKRENSH